MITYELLYVDYENWAHSANKIMAYEVHKPVFIEIGSDLKSVWGFD